MTTRQPVKVAKRGDQVYIEQQLTDLSTPGGQTDPIDLSGATVRFIMEGPDGNLIVNSSATVVGAEAGVVEYLFADGELPKAGEYRGEWRVIKSPDEDYRWPPGPGNYLEITIGEPIATDRDPAEIDPKQDLDVALIQAEEGVIQTLSVPSAPQNETDVLRQAEYEELDGTKADRVGDTIDPAQMRPNGHPYVDVTSDEYGVEPGVWYSGWDGTTDHTADLQAAIDSARNDHTQARTFFPTGEYYISSPLEYEGPTMIGGGGVRATRIVATEPMNAIFQPKDRTTDDEMVNISHFELECNNNANYAVDLEQVQRWGLKWLHCRTAAQAGIRTDQSWLGSAQYISAPQCHNAIELGQGNNGIAIRDSWLGYNDNLSVVCPEGGGLSVVFDNCQFEGTQAFDMTDVNIQIFINNGYFEYQGDPPMIQLDNVKYFYVSGIFTGFQATFADVTDTDFRMGEFVFRDYRGDGEKLSLNSKPTEFNLRFLDGALALSPDQIRYLPQARLINHHYDASDAILDTDSDGDGTADNWFFANNSGNGNAFMAGAGLMENDPVQRLELGQFDSLRKSFPSPLDAGDYTITMIYRVHNARGRTPKVAVMDSSSNNTPVTYNSNGNDATLPHNNSSRWHLANFNINVASGDDVAGFWPAWTQDSSSEGTLNMDIAAVQVYDGEYHVGEITPYDVQM